MPDAFRENRLPTFPADGGDRDCRKKFTELDGKCRMHNMARRIAAMPSKQSRNDYIAALKHAPPVIERLKQLVRYYWRRQRKKTSRQISGVSDGAGVAYVANMANVANAKNLRGLNGKQK